MVSFLPPSYGNCVFALIPLPFSFYKYISNNIAKPLTNTRDLPFLPFSFCLSSFARLLQPLICCFLFCNCKGSLQEILTVSQYLLLVSLGENLRGSMSARIKVVHQYKRLQPPTTVMALVGVSCAVAAVSLVMRHNPINSKSTLTCFGCVYIQSAYVLSFWVRMRT